MKTLIVSLLFLSSPAAALIGQDASQGFGRVGYLYLEGTFGPGCIATLLEQDIAVTSAHCLERVDWRRSQAVSFARSREIGFSPIVDFIIHSGYVKTAGVQSGFDLALVRLEHEWGSEEPAYSLAERAVVLTEEATVISLQHQEGDLRDQRPDSMGTARIVFRKIGEDSRLILADAKDSGAKICPGDSGAPVVQNGVLIGIMTSGRMPADIPREKLNCKDFSSPQFLSLYHHREWIKQATAQLRSRQAPAATISRHPSAAALKLPTAEELSALLAH